MMMPEASNPGVKFVPPQNLLKDTMIHKAKASCRVLTSAKSLADLEEKQRLKAEKEAFTRKQNRKECEAKKKKKKKKWVGMQICY